MKTRLSLINGISMASPTPSTTSSKAMNDITTKKEVKDRINDMMLNKIPTHSHRIQCLSEPKKNKQTSSMYFKRLKLHYSQADIERMNWKNLLAHQVLNKIPETEIYKDIRKAISAELSAYGREKVLKLDELISKLKDIKADRTANDLANTKAGRSNNHNKNHQIKSQAVFPFAQIFWILPIILDFSKIVPNFPQNSGQNLSLGIILSFYTK